MADPTTEQLAARLYKVAESAATAKYGRRLKLSAAGGLKELTQAAAEEVISPKAFGVRSTRARAKTLTQRTKEAEVAVRALVDAMASHAESIHRYDPDRLGERTLAFAMYNRLGFCPCWPFC
jgi:hypothetical protein